MSSQDAFSFHVSHVRVQVRCELTEVLAGLAAVWSACARPLRPVTDAAELIVTREGEDYMIRGPNESRRTRHVVDVLPLVEAVLYAELQRWHRGLLVLHAACVESARATFVLLARSGGGKSSLARAAVQLGLRYHSDELTLSDGLQLWGVPRAIQFDPLPDSAPSPAWLRGVDRTSYRLRLAGDEPGSVPLWAPPSECVAAAPAAVQGVRVYSVERAGRDELLECAALDTLAALHEAAHRPPRLDLGAWVRPGCHGRLRWADPNRGLRLLLDAL